MRSIFDILYLLLAPQILSQPCPNSCSGQGSCHTPDRTCKCFTGFHGADCSLLQCPMGPAWADQATGIDKAHNLAVCSNKGICDTLLGSCRCMKGFEGGACQRKSCPNKCNNKGTCLSMQEYALKKDPGSGVIYRYDTIWDATKIYGCDCDDRYYGPDCSLRYCPRGDDPLTGNSQNTVQNPIQVNEIQGITCKAASGFFTLTFQGQSTRNIPFNAKFDPEGQFRTRSPGSVQSYIEALPNIGKFGIVVSTVSTQACLDTSNGASWTIEYLQNFGNLPLIVPDTTQLKSASSRPIVVTVINEGTKENAECSNRGICDSKTGICNCVTNFDTSNGYNAPGLRGDCGHATTTIQFCPGIVSCSGHGLGQCPGSPTYKCTCAAGWTGADCSLRTCPTGVSWFTYPSADNVAHLFEQVECSDAGKCDRSSGNCVCDAGFTGTKCELMACPGDILPCNGNGRCLNMNQLASLTKVNGDIAGFSYGATPNNPVTWDAFKVQGCLCNEDYTGYDCSLSVCAYGDDPVTIYQFDETQQLSCVSPSPLATVTLSFRGGVTAPISATATVDEVKAALELVSTFGKVSVDLADTSLPNALCSTSGAQKFLVTFQTVHGDVPMIKLFAKTVISDGNFVVTELVKGTKENKECSGRGICDPTTGRCSCFVGFSDSDGMGNLGSINDCGYADKIYINQIV